MGDVWQPHGVKFFLTSMDEPLIMNASLLGQRGIGKSSRGLTRKVCQPEEGQSGGSGFANEEEKNGEGTGSCFGFWRTV